MNYLKYICLTILLISCTDKTQQIGPVYKNVKTLPDNSVELLTLNGDVAKRSNEFSGLAWYKDNLVMLPQYAGRDSTDGGGFLFVIKKKRILDFIQGRNTSPITAKKIKFIAKGLEKYNSIGSGYESISFDGNKVYVTIESNSGTTTIGNIVLGNYNESKNVITLDASSLKEIKSQSGIFNLSEEALLITENDVVTFHEANGRNVNPNPVAHLFDKSLNFVSTIPFPHIEYRITDAANIGSDSTFWVMNYFWPGDRESLNPAADSLVFKYGISKSNNDNPAIERIIKLKYSSKGISLVKRPPIYLDITNDPNGRNWEGIVKLDSLGFLITTDKFPTSLLGFVAILNQN